MILKDLKKGDYFKLVDRKGNENKTIYVKGEYARDLKKYSITKFIDINSERFIKGNQKVTKDFIF